MKFAWPALALGLLGIVGAILWQSMISSKESEISNSAAELIDAETSTPDAASALRIEVEKALAQALVFLIDQQAEDGGWHSETYGAFRGGAATTAMVLYAAASLPETMQGKYQAHWQQGWNFLQPGFEQQGYVCNPDGSADYPTYATALAYLGAKQLGLEFPDSLQQRYVDYLLAAQLTEAQGWTPEDLHYGGWDMAGGSTIAGHRVTPGTNLSVTRFALEALALAGAEALGPAQAEVSQDRSVRIRSAFQKAESYLARCQDQAGAQGFAFNADVADASNKAGVDAVTGQIRPYGTMTCDGVLALVALRQSQSKDPQLDERISRATAWLESQPALFPEVPGFTALPETADLAWQSDLRFYYYAGLAQLARAELTPKLTTAQTNWRQQLIELILAEQAADGSWANTTETVRMREDDPLIATPLAMLALAELARSLGSGE